MRRFVLLLLVGLLGLISLASAAQIQGTIYNSDFEPEMNVLVTIDTIPVQKLLVKNGEYSFAVPVGNYTISAVKEEFEVHEKIEIVAEGMFVYDLFLFPSFAEEEDLLNEAQGKTEIILEDDTRVWAYVVGAIIFILLLVRIIHARKKYGPLRIFRRKIKEESQKTVEQHRQELAEEPGYLEQALDIIKKHDGRITQRELRKEMLYLSEAKVSLLVTELEHKGLLQKVKKGRGNVLILNEAGH